MPRVLERMCTRRTLLLSGTTTAAAVPWALLLTSRSSANPEALARRARELEERHGLRIGYGFLCGELRLRGVSVAATYGPAWIVIRAEDGPSSRENAKDAEHALHHELASFLWNADPLLRIAWGALLPANWQEESEIGTIVEAPYSGDERTAEGFLTPYGATTASNDFSTYAEAAFLEPQRLLELAAVHSVIRQKAGLLLRTYIERDPRMTSVFGELGFADLLTADPSIIELELELPVIIPEGTIIR